MPHLVRRLETLRNLLCDLEGLVNWDPSALQTFRQILAFDELEDEEGLAVRLLEPVDRRDVGMVQRGEEMGLALETGEPLGVPGHVGRKRLDGDLAAELRVGGPVDLPHPPGPEGSQDLVGTDACSCRQRHGAALLGVKRWGG
jgi:hypothetical protein